MVEKIKANKDRVLAYMETRLAQPQMNVREMGELADIVKDLAEAEKYCWEAQYYRTVTEAMEDNEDVANYTVMKYDDGNNARRGYGSGYTNHTNAVESIRNMLATMPHEQRMQIRNELSMM
jgi:hypothetical protein